MTTCPDCRGTVAIVPVGRLDVYDIHAIGSTKVFCPASYRTIRV